MEDELLHFEPDGVGLYCYLRPWYVAGSVFSWRLDGDRLTSPTVREFAREKEIASEEGLRFDGSGIRIWFSEAFAFQMQETTRVLELDLTEADLHLLENKYAYIGPDCLEIVADQIDLTRAHFAPHDGIPPP